MQAHVDSDTDVDCLDFKSNDYDIDVDVEPELDDSTNLTMIPGTEDQEVVVAGIEQPLHMDADNMAPNVELAELSEFTILH